jgi:hypothetical protein
MVENRMADYALLIRLRIYWEKAPVKISKKRLQLLITLENIVGNECYNGNIQNWGPGGVYEGEGREFRFPITFNTEDGTKIKRRSVDENLPASVVMTGRYKFGANELNIIRALNKVVSYLENNHGLSL